MLKKVLQALNYIQNLKITKLLEKIKNEKGSRQFQTRLKLGYLLEGWWKDQTTRTNESLNGLR